MSVEYFTKKSRHFLKQRFQSKVFNLFFKNTEGSNSCAAFDLFDEFPQILPS